MKHILKTILSKLPFQFQQEMKRMHFARHIKTDNFQTNEPEINILGQIVKSGDTVLDIGANIGQYTHKLSQLVGEGGRVIAFEPVLYTFELLAANAAIFPIKNVTLFNAAASDKTNIIGIKIPKFCTGLDNYYMAHITSNSYDISALCLSVDSLNLTPPVTLAKIDVEGHELSVLKGMKNILERDHPTLIIEGKSNQVATFLNNINYTFEEYKDSPNRVYRHENKKH